MGFVGRLLEHATFGGGGGSVNGAEVLQEMFEKTVVTYADGTPKTKHVTTNMLIDIDEESGGATARSYFTVLQALPDLPLQTIVAGRYADRFDYVDGHWRFADRQVTIDLFGDVSRHLRHTPR
ncbi:nuclear transport factor 2 family protein [Williamsia sp. 1135]|uniref:nuclear transport factor 2 family protein n=1 Tax=Williamsia sp. 1135 TaxID=1889262 RepID=UPI000A0FC1E6|nr:nuclear transport factor 2 family protein [Williamsia sp. 1135]ORM33389.1 hypothetical protein BFL43_13705 [Williamsia sp. 1135]